MKKSRGGSETPPEDENAKIIIDTVETALNESGEFTTLPTDMAGQYIQIKIEEAREEDQGTIINLQNELEIWQRDYATLDTENNTLKKVQKETIEQFVTKITEALGHIATEATEPTKESDKKE
jgi:hypothetical protein